MRSATPAHYRIFCDESWNRINTKGVDTAFFVFHGIMVQAEFEDEILSEISRFRNEFGYGHEIKWKKVQDEFNSVLKSGYRSRYEIYLESIFFRFLRQKKLSFGAMYLPMEDYVRVENAFLTSRGSTKHDFFFMLYYQFLTHCFLKNQASNSFVEILIDDRTVGSLRSHYDLERFRRILNHKHVETQRWKSQIDLDPTWLVKVRKAVQSVSLNDSKHFEFIQLADLVAGCFRFVRENEIHAPVADNQRTLFEPASKRELKNGADFLTDFFLRELRSIKGYEKINLCERVWQYHFNIFPIRLPDRRSDVHSA